MDIHVTVMPSEEQLLPNGTAVFEVTIPEIDVRQYVYLPFDEFHRFFNAPEGVEADLLVVADTVYLVDQLVHRSHFPDNWTRELSLSIPVEDPVLWNEVSASFADVLQFLTGDKWQLVFNGREIPIYHHRNRRLRRKPLYRASAVCLFSGGLDSLVGAIDWLEEQAEAITLVSHYDLGSTAKKAQAHLANRLQREYPWRINLIQTRVGGVSHVCDSQDVFGRVQNPKAKETTFRSRSIIFLALGMYVAKQQSTDEINVPLLVPENGFIALNPPLTDARLGSCSTKTTHPVFLDRLQGIAEQLGILNTIHNPLVNKSKGDVLTQAMNQVLVQELALQSISCAHPTRRQGWYRRSVTHCGYCVPCLFRRASLHRVGLDYGTDYGFDVWAGELGMTEEIAVDFRAMLSWVYNAHYGGCPTQKIVSRMNLPETHQEIAQQVIQSGLNEMTQIISDKAEDHIKQWAGLEDV
jgi:7-cyano-7-deazaguanine synthase in queuosine biosynthesis